MSGFYNQKQSAGSITIYDEGVFLGDATSINFAGAGVVSTIMGADVTATISGSTGVIVYDETPTGSGIAFTLAFAPSPAGSLILWKNGQNLTAGGVDFTLSGLNLTMVLTVNADDVLLAKMYTR